jgi:hypothetical protein
MAVVAVLNAQEKAKALELFGAEWKAIDMAEEKRHEEALTEWTTEWNTQEAKFDEQTHFADIDKDVHRSGLLACGIARGLSQQEMSTHAKVDQSWISRHLRYGRFNRFMPFGIKLTEGKFRQYWEQSRDAAATKGRRTPEYVEAYEQKVFKIIAEKIESGHRPAPKVKRLDKPKEVKTRAQQRQYTKALREEVRHIHHDMAADIKALIAMGDQEMLRTSPVLIANHAKRLEAGFRKFEKVLQDQTNVDFL